MRQYIHILTIVFLGLLCFTFLQETHGQDSYPRDSTISNSKGVPRDSLTFYFPTSIKLNGETTQLDFDNFLLNWYSSALYAFKEPILYNFYQGHDSYRFLWLRSFNRPIVFIISKNADSVSLTIKELDRQPSFFDKHLVNWPFKEKIKKKNRFKTITVTKDTIIKADRKANIVLSQTKKLSLKEWDKFESLIMQCHFWAMKPIDRQLGCDGAEWIIEAHLKGRYFFVNRWSPDKSNYSNCGKYLIELSGQKYEIY